MIREPLKRKLIGEGSTGIVIYPSLNGDVTMITKLADKDHIEKEINNIQIMPQSKLWILPQNPKLKKISDSDLTILRSIEELEDYNNTNDYQYYYDLPYIKGETLCELSDPDILLTQKFKNHMIQFLHEINRIHQMGFFHGAIFCQNIIYDGNQLYLVDFGTFGKSNEGIEGEKEDIKEILEDMDLQI